MVNFPFLNTVCFILELKSTLTKITKAHPHFYVVLLTREHQTVSFKIVAGGPSGSGKTSLAHKMANIVGCEVISLESYYKSEQVKDFKYDDFNSLDLSLLSKVWRWMLTLFYSLS